MNHKNQFDARDIILLVITLIIIYIFISWFGNNGEVMDYGNPFSTEQTQAETP